MRSSSSSACLRSASLSDESESLEQLSPPGRAPDSTASVVLREVADRVREHLGGRSVSLPILRG